MSCFTLGPTDIQVVPSGQEHDEIESRRGRHTTIDAEILYYMIHNLYCPFNLSILHRYHHMHHACASLSGVGFVANTVVCSRNELLRPGK